MLCFLPDMSGRGGAVLVNQLHRVAVAAGGEEGGEEGIEPGAEPVLQGDCPVAGQDTLLGWSDEGSENLLESPPALAPAAPRKLRVEGS